MLFQPSVHFTTASSTIFCLWFWEILVSCFENADTVSTPGWLFVNVHVHVYVYVYVEYIQDVPLQITYQNQLAGALAPSTQIP